MVEIFGAGDAVHRSLRTQGMLHAGNSGCNARVRLGRRGGPGYYARGSSCSRILNPIPQTASI